MNNIKKVHVIFKTHLDVGFTELASKVVDNYINVFIPKAIELSYDLNKEGKSKKFVWTTGSWIIDEYLRRAGKSDKIRFVDAAAKGYIAWHALPFTTHSEIMDEDLFEFGISICRNLDKMFSRNTIAAKMTDVPGHTRGIIKPLCRNNIKYIHIGVNGGSHKPDVFDTFIWRDSNGNEVIVDYCQGYGKVSTIEGFDQALVFAHSGDNLGPPSKEDILIELEKIQKQFPNAQIEASTLDDYAAELLKFKDKLPVICDEIGDTWIHGTASDPYKLSAFLELLRLKDKWIIEKKLEKNSNTYREFLRNLLMIPEHTWGLDFKKFLADFKNWSKEDFYKAREKDILDESSIPEKYLKHAEFARQEFELLIKDKKWEDRKYSYFEYSHEEQRNYIKSAVNSLPMHLKNEAENALDMIKNPKPPKINECFFEIETGKEYDIKGYKVLVQTDGSVKISGRNFKKPAVLGTVSYEIFGTNTYEKWAKDYILNYEQNAVWADSDFLKPGIEGISPKDNKLYFCSIDKCFMYDDELIIKSNFSKEECGKYGCPRNATVKYKFLENEILISVYFSGKDASRLPEAVWISHFTDSSIKDIRLKKIDEIINPKNVVMYGNRNYHAVREVLLELEGTNCKIIPLDSILVSPGERRLYNFSQKFADFSKGMHFNVYNNLWGTNFKMWYEEDIISRFRIITN